MAKKAPKVKLVTMHTLPTLTVLSPQIFDRQCSVCVLEYIQQYPRPVAAVAEFAQIREWLLR